jgi:phage terminase large subunit-like protein
MTESQLDLLLRHNPDVLDRISPAQARQIRYDWELNRRPAQAIPDGMGTRYRTWILRAGRGFGKTRTGAETTRYMTGHVGRIALIAPTAADTRDVMIEGESGLLSVFPPDERPTYIPSLRRVNFQNGAFAIIYSAEEPERLRGPQHEWAWIDEPASMRYGDNLLSNLLLGLRLGANPWLLITGTPKPVKWLRQLSEEPTTYTTTGTTYDNARNLSPSFIEDIKQRYEGTRLGRQELYAEFLDDVEGALWSETVINQTRFQTFDLSRPWEALTTALTGQNLPRADRRPWRVIVAVDPPGETAECGIIVAAAPVNGRAGIDHAVILEDGSTAGRPEAWGKQVAMLARKWGAERVVVESNQGGDMTRATIASVDPSLRIEKITARLSKANRAEPVSAQYDRGLIHHVGFFPLLEQQMTTWVPSDSRSPDRMDALVHAVASLLASNGIAKASVSSVASRRF